MNLADHRKAIDALDSEIVRLLNQRTKHVLAIGGLKLKSGEEIYAPHRELAVLERVCQQNSGPITNQSLRAIYREIMSSALSLEKTMIIAYLGPEATFTHQAAIRRFGSSLRYAPQKTIDDVFSEVSRNRADYGVVPVESSSDGVVTNTFDLFVESDLKIVAQIVLPIQHCLVSKVAREKVRKLYAHPEALAQCRAWVQNHLPQVAIIESSSTTRAAESAARTRASAAITGPLAAAHHQLTILQMDIQDDSASSSRFLVLGRQCSPATGRDRTSFMLGIPDEVGALDRIIALLRKCKVNISQIKSQPNKHHPSRSLMFIDCDGHLQDAKIDRALELLREQCQTVKVLGSYPNSE